MDDMEINSDSGRLVVKFKADDSKFQALLKKRPVSGCVTLIDLR